MPAASWRQMPIKEKVDPTRSSTTGPMVVYIVVLPLLLSELLLLASKSVHSNA
jgi:hypothetical protein